MLPRVINRVPLTLTFLGILIISIILNTINIHNLQTLQDQLQDLLTTGANFKQQSPQSSKPKYVVYSKKPNGEFLRHVFNGFQR